MNNLHTEENYLRYYYGETDLFETMEIDFQLNEDIISNINYSVFAEKLQLLNKVVYRPSEKCIDQILAYSKL